MSDMQFELSDDVVKQLKSLIQLDIDASLAYQKAIDGVEEQHPEVKASLQQFKADHERHILELSNVVSALGQDPPEYKRDAKGFLIEGMTAMRAALGTRQALKAMRQNEMLTNAKYEKAMQMEALPSEVMDIIARGRADERVHLAYIEQVLVAFEEGAAIASTVR